MVAIKALNRESTLSDYTAEAMLEYGTEVVEQRAVPDFRDGLKPVHRAIIWAMYGLHIHHNSPYKKAARTVGEVIGVYHPHGDQSTYSTMVNMANMPLNLIDGYGNWGNFKDEAAAYRYTESRLSKYSDKLLLDPLYLSVSDMIPNFSEDAKIPLVLPARLPIALLIGNTSIAVGIAASCPPFHIDGVTKLVKLALSGKKITPKHCLKYLRFNYRYGGECISTDDELLDFYRTGQGSVRFRPSYVLNRKNKEMRITSVCPGLMSEASIENMLERIAKIDGVSRAMDISDKNNKICYEILFGRVSDERIDAAIKAILKLIERSERYDIGITERMMNGRSKFSRITIPDLIHKWIDWRVDLEKKVIQKRIANEQEKIDEIDIVIFAIDNFDTIYAALKKDDSVKFLMTKLKITEEKAQRIMKFRLEQLKKQERSVLVSKRKELAAKIKIHERELKEPESVVLRDLETII
jgi:DNA gyrase/topoisomerase IV subunit A